MITKVRRRHKPLPQRNPTDLGKREADGKHPSATSTTSPTRSARSVDGQCRWRPEGYSYPRQPPSLPDRELVDPHLADSDFLASILDSIDAMAPAATSSSAPPPTDGLHSPYSLFLFVLV